MSLLRKDVFVPQNRVPSLITVLKLFIDWGGLEWVRNQAHLSVWFLIAISFNNLLYCQDYSKFMDEDFDVKEWVNGAFNSQKEGNKDVSYYNTSYLTHHHVSLFNL